ncbi:MAG: hypothetical protein EP298_04030 [Gammaproteobacteria bacterium]|nr:MAG: hypothetical protein EP298_04030 [Gammaproteobacteria bacterium]UTW43799.1 hypothetical protein KFE69_06840 [bacterium SCSIO 12844]
MIKTIKTNVIWQDRDSQEQEILKAMNKENIQHTLPEFNIIKMTWKKIFVEDKGRLFFQMIKYHTWVTNACYAKLVSGHLSGSYFENISDQWGLCGTSKLLNHTSYTTPHPYAQSETGEVHFCLLGTVAGRFPLDRNNPKWGYLPYIQVLED